MILVLLLLHVDSEVDSGEEKRAKKGSLCSSYMLRKEHKLPSNL